MPFFKVSIRDITHINKFTPFQSLDNLEYHVRSVPNLPDQIFQQSYCEDKSLFGWVVDFVTGEVDSAHGRSLAWTTLPMGGVDRGQLGSKG